MTFRSRFEVRFVDAARRRYVFRDSYPKFADAALACDIGKRKIGGDWIVWDSWAAKQRNAKPIVYDTRELAAKFAQLELPTSSPSS